LNQGGQSAEAGVHVRRLPNLGMQPTASGRS
jgi:hypothetical protein